MTQVLKDAGAELPRHPQWLGERIPFWPRPNLAEVGLIYIYLDYHWSKFRLTLGYVNLISQGPYMEWWWVGWFSQGWWADGFAKKKMQPRGQQMLFSFSIKHPILGVLNFDSSDFLNVVVLYTYIIHIIYIYDVYVLFPTNHTSIIVYHSSAISRKYSRTMTRPFSFLTEFLAQEWAFPEIRLFFLSLGLLELRYIHHPAISVPKCLISWGLLLSCLNKSLSTNISQLEKWYQGGHWFMSCVAWEEGSPGSW